MNKLESPTTNMSMSNESQLNNETSKTEEENVSQNETITRIKRELVDVPVRTNIGIDGTQQYEFSRHNDIKNPN